METNLVQHIRKFTTLDDQDVASLLRFFEPLSLKKKACLLEEGEICRYNYFVEKGCLRMYYIDDKGTEQTNQFAIENWWLADYMSFDKQTPSPFYIQAIEKSTVYGLEHSKQNQLFEEFPQMERYFLLILQRAYAASQLRMKYMHDFSKEEIYHHIAARFPEFIQRVPQYMLASYLGFTPEYLSEIRKKTS